MKSAILKEYENRHDALGEGRKAICFPYNSHEVIKIYKDEECYPNIENIKKIINIKNDSYIFLTNMIIENNQTTAIILPRVIAGDIEWNDFLLNDFFNAIDKVYNDTDEISSKNIKSNDLCPQNILFDGKYIKIVDTDEYKTSNKKIENLHLNNIYNLNHALCEAVAFPQTIIENLGKPNDLLELYNITFNYNNNCKNKNIIKFLKLVQYYTEEINKKKIYTINEMRTNVRKRK